jgi:hypothetical protein
MISDNSNNVFNYSGFFGSGPGKHSSRERFSSESLRDFFSKLNEISYLVRFNHSLNNTFVGMFYGLISFTYNGGVTKGQLVDTYSSYGINLEQSIVVRDNTTDPYIEIPIEEEMLADKLIPTCVFHLYDTSSPQNFVYLPQFHGASLTKNKVVRVSFIDLGARNFVDNNFFINISRYQLSVFGYCIYNQENL